MVLSIEADASIPVLLFGEKATAQTDAVWSSSVRQAVQVRWGCGD